MTLYEFCEVCKLPSEGRIEEPRPRDVEDFIDEVTIGEGRERSKARVSSLHFPGPRYYSLFVGRCLIGRGDSGGLSALIRPFCIMLLYCYFLHYGLLLHVIS